MPKIRSKQLQIRLLQPTPVAAHPPPVPPTYQMGPNQDLMATIASSKIERSKPIIAVKTRKTLQYVSCRPHKYNILTSMSSSCLIRRGISPLTVARGRTCFTSPYRSSSLLSSTLGTCRASRFRCTVHAAPFSSLLLSRSDSLLNRNVSSVASRPSKRFYFTGKKPWQKDNNWKTTLQTGGLVLLGTGALIASTSCTYLLVLIAKTQWQIIVIFVC